MGEQDRRQMADLEVISEESYLAQHGASRQNIGDAALHKNIGTGRAKARLLDRQAKSDYELIASREALRQEYQTKIEAGEIRPPTRTERLILTANGHPDLAATQAARRLLKSKT